jgi:diaminohydroxyphosphoribosylaminopyrimidine deaminase/5-amino-6-(5-phosphoribosylamino)uracil reductase
VEVVSCRTRKGRVDIGAALAQLGKRRMTNLLVEGGSAVLSAFLDARLADEAYIFVAPRLIGGTNAPTAYAGTGSASIDQGVSITQCSLRRLGPDAFFRLRLAAT